MCCAKYDNTNIKVTTPQHHTMTSSRPKTPARGSHTAHTREVVQDRVPSRRGRRLQTQSDVNFYNTRETVTPAHSPVDSDERMGSGSRMDATQTRRAARRENSMEDVNLNSYKPSANSDLQPSRRNNNVAPLNKTSDVRVATDRAASRALTQTAARSAHAQPQTPDPVLNARRVPDVTVVE